MPTAGFLEMVRHCEQVPKDCTGHFEQVPKNFYYYYINAPSVYSANSMLKGFSDGLICCVISTMGF